jgi:ABC-type branched-subunit amino acid transport system ATPase component
MSEPTLLEVSAATKRFGGLAALDGVDFQVQAGRIYGIIGPNGAGKSTFVNVCTGVYRPTAGTILLQGEDVTGRPPHYRSRRGMARSFQNLMLFAEATVLDNVLAAAEVRHCRGFTATILGTPSARTARAAALAEAEQWLAFMGLEDRRDDLAGGLPAGSQRQLEIARALATDPRILFLDEPAAGLSDDEKSALMDAVRRLAERGIAIVLIEHNMPFVMGLCESIMVLNFGRKIAEGTPAEIISDEQVIEAYLGPGDDDEEDELGPSTAVRGVVPPAEAGD